MARTDDWVVKGGTGMMCRFGKVRSTKDLDLFKATSDGSDSFASAQELVRVMDGLTVGAYTFSCSSSSSSSSSPSADEDRNSHRVTVEATSRGSSPVARFAIDVSARGHLSKEPDTTMAERSDEADIPGYPRRFPGKMADPNFHQQYATYEAAVAIVEHKVGPALNRVGPSPTA